jgi:multicomponent K+:H+ antiporter subunit A
MTHLSLIVLIPLAAAVLPAVFIAAGRNVCAIVTACVSLASFTVLMSYAPAVFAGEVVQGGFEWAPQVGLSFSFFLDALGFFFAAMILGVGLLVIVYARFYLRREDPMGRFYAYLLVFQGAMLGVVLSDNVLLLVVFWELTSLSSFLLIGYWSHLPEGRQGARMALVVTGGGGLLLMGGMLLLGHAAGSFELTQILKRGDVIQSSPLYAPILVLTLAGAFTKSAQFPFHFWLPHAMAAPTPVSAYLHSATMVKAGVFLLARLWPALAGGELWFLIVTPVGLVTMLVGAWIALFKTDLKAILAYSTVSHLGLMTMLLGFATPAAALACVFHILNHATFKAALFMSAGIVDHETGTRDINRLGGLIHLMPISATLALVAAFSMAGAPAFNGFLSKEMMLEAAAHTAYAGNAWIIPASATIAALLSVAYSLRFAHGVYLKRAASTHAHPPHDPPFGMWAPVAFLVAPVVGIGLFPALLAGPLVARTTQAVIGAAPLPATELALWHGLTPALLMSLAAFAGAVALLAAFHRLERMRERVWRPEAKTLFDIAQDAMVRAARWTSDRLHTNSLPRYLAVICATLVFVGAAAFFTGNHARGARATLPVNPAAIVAWVILVGACVVVVTRHEKRLLTLILTSVVGLVVSLAFLQFSAPDLALTQISVEVVTTIFMLLALNLLPKRSPLETSLRKRSQDAAIAISAGLGVGAIAYAILTRDHNSISEFYLARSLAEGGGSNVVNVILVDFRGFDTFGEIIVLSIAALAIFALLDTALKGVAARRLDALRASVEAADVHPLMLVVATRTLLPLALVVGFYIFLRGHNQPGGGFIAGLVVAIAFLMQYMASGYGWSQERARFDPHALIGAGVIVAGLTGLGSLLFGRPFLTSSFGHFHLPLVGDIELATAIVFDAGVFLAVVGTVMLSLAQIARVERRAERNRAPEGPIDIRLPRIGAAPPGAIAREEH